MGHGAVLLENMEKRVNSSPPVGIGAEMRRENVPGINTKGLVVTIEANQYEEAVRARLKNNSALRVEVVSRAGFVDNRRPLHNLVKITTFCHVWNISLSNSSTMSLGSTALI